VGSRRIKGLTAPVDVWRLHGLKDKAGQHRSLVGRQAEIAQCTAALTAAREGKTGTIVYLRGDAGIGKSSLAAETMRQAVGLGFTGIRAAAFDFGAGLERDPLRVLALALLNAVVPSSERAQAVERFSAAAGLTDADVLALKDLVGMELSPDERRRLDAMNPTARLAARSWALAGVAVAAANLEPLLVLFEDAHWADRVTLQGLAAMTKAACGSSRAVVVITSRIQGDPLAILRPLVGELPPMLVELGPLPPDDARALATELMDTPDPLLEQYVARAGGNPLFLEQLIRHANSGGLASAIPGSIRSVVTAQVDQLGSPEKVALQAAAVLGDEFSVAALRHLLGRPDWDPATLIASRLVRSGKDVLQFTHALIRDGIYASILTTKRQSLHRAAAKWFDGRDNALRAEHLAKADDPSAIAAYLAAAEELVKAYRLDEGLSLLERARNAGAAPSDRFVIDLRQGDLLAELGRSDEAIAAYERALESASDDVTKASAKLGRAGAMRLLDRNKEALALLDEVEAVFSREGRLIELARLEHLRGNLVFPLGQTALCQAAHEKALAYAERCGSIELKARALGGLGDAAFANGCFLTAHRRFTECVELAHEHGYGRIEVANAPMLGAVSSNAASATETAERAVLAAAAAHQPRAELTARQVAMGVHLWCGRPEAALAHAERAQDIVHQAGARRLEALNLTCMGEACRQQGDRQQALSMHEQALAIAREAGMSYVGALVLGYRALAAYDDEAFRVASIREGERTVASGAVAHSALHFYSCAIEASLLARDWTEARRLAGCLEEYFAVEPTPLTQFLVERARLLADLGENGTNAPSIEALRQFRERSAGLGLALFFKLMDKALAAAPS
jgi:tetratricopeptide (TPR) repeat protein